jgi:uncharacterized membrane-anchored protein YjiN (DUF445 family)
MQEIRGVEANNLHPNEALSSSIAPMRLRRMKIVATGTLLLMVVVFVAASFAGQHWRAAKYVKAFAEAAMIGGCADWFAVTALFRRPFGLPIPHTGIISRNQDRIGNALAAFIADNFLTEAVLEVHLHQMEVAHWGATWVMEPGRAKTIAQAGVAGFRQLIVALPRGAVRQIASSMSIAALQALPASVTASRLLELLWSGGRADRMVAIVLKALSRFIGDRQEIILAQVQAHSFKWMPSWIDRIVARKIASGLFQLLEEAQDPDHPMRLTVDESVRVLIGRLADDPELIAWVEAAKTRLLNEAVAGAELDQVWFDIEQWLDDQLDPRSDTLSPILEKAILLWAEWLENAPDVQAIFNTTARTLMKSAVSPRRHDIGRFFGEIVSSWDTVRLVSKLELQIGPDLQYIRINGALVGGMVGLAIYTSTQLLGLG